MKSIDFAEWLASNEPVDDEEAYELYRATQGKESFGTYDVKIDGNRILISKSGGRALPILTEKAYQEFVRRVDNYCPDLELGWEGYEALRRGMNTDH
jgi:hypothetical protein